MRRPIVAANWKMNKTASEARQLAQEVRGRLEGFDAAEVVLCPPFTALHAVGSALEPGPIRLGAQDLHWEAAGAFTGEVSAAMLVEAGCAYVIVGHSERRTRFHESDEDVRRKIGAALAAGLTPIVCIGETLEDREHGRTEEVLRRQGERSFAGLGDALRRVVIAYEPLWAIGTGRTATPEQAQGAHGVIRDLVRGGVGEDVAGVLRILYGGSVHAGNAAELFRLPDVDGGLIGAASLEAGSFAAVVRAIV